MIKSYGNIVLISILSTSCSLNSIPEKALESELVLQTDRQKSSYAQGVLYMRNLQKTEVPLDADVFMRGIQDVQNKTSLRLNPEQITRGRDWVYVQQSLYMERTSKKNVAKGEAFLKANKTKLGVVSLPSGIQYKILIQGTGKQKPVLTDTVAMHYKITKLKGGLFYSTEKEQQVPRVQVSSIIKGWQEALLLMSVGAKWELYIPGTLAYGEAVDPEGILEPNETLIFDVELIGINLPTSAQSKAPTFGPNGDIKPSSRW